MRGVRLLEVFDLLMDGREIVGDLGDGGLRLAGK